MGCIHWIRKTGKFTRYPYDPSRPEKLSRPPLGESSDNDFISFIKEDLTGKNLDWFCDGGINSYDPVTPEKLLILVQWMMKKLKASFCKRHAFRV